jgi:HAD superfamily hydrolase (TIGR01458 family)
MIAGVLLDIDGVLTVSWRPLAGAVATIGWLQEQGLDFCLVTNSSSKTRRQIADLLAGAGMAVEVGAVHTAVTSAARYLTEHHPDVPCWVLNEGDLGEDLVGVEMVGPDRAGVVLLGGAGPSVGYDALNDAFRLAVDGVPLVALHRNTRYQVADGLALDMGAFLVGLEAAAGVEAVVVGKPSAAFFGAALDDLGVGASEAVMVGDDLVSDVLGAQALGMTGALVRTGKFRPSDLVGGGPAPDHVLEDIGALPALIDELGRS